MAIAATVTYSGQGYSAGGQVLSDGVQPGNASSNIDGKVALVLDGAATSVVVPFIDGVQTLPYTPQAIQFSWNGGTAVYATVLPLVTAIANTGFTVTLAAAGTNAQTINAAFRIIR